MTLFPKKNASAFLILALALSLTAVSTVHDAYAQNATGQLRRTLWIPQIYALAFGATAQANSPQLARSAASELSLTSGALRITAATPLIFEGSTDDANETSIAVTDPTADNVFTLPDVVSDTFTFIGATQTLVAKTLTSPIFGTSVVLDQTTEDYTLTWDDPAAARAISIPDPLGTDVFVFADMIQTLLAKTLTNPIIAVANPLEGAVSNQPRWMYKLVEHGDMTTAGTADTFTVFTLPANTIIYDVIGNVTAAWAGTGPVSAAVCSVGTSGGSANDLSLDDEFFAVQAVYELHDATASGGKGTLIMDSTDKFAPHFASSAATIEIQCDMTAAATADTFTLWTLPANTMIHDVMATVVTGWSGGSISAAVASVGSQAGPANGFALDDNFFSTGTRYELHDATAIGGKGIRLFDTTDKFAPFMFLAGGVIELQMDLTGDDHANATAGQARIYILVSQPLANTTIEAN